MQISISKHIFLISLLVMFPLVLSAQIGKRKYVTRSGDTTLVVMAGSTGLHGEDAQFLLDQRATEDFQSKRSRYTRLKDAVNETNQVANIVEVEKQETNPSTSSLGFRIAQQNVRYLQKEKEAETIARNNINRGATIDEMVYLKEKFGNKPSYFINGIQVDPSIAGRVLDKDILTRELKVSNTVTGNPNGEIWIVIGSRAFNRLNIDVHYAGKDRMLDRDENESLKPSKIENTQPSSALSDKYKEQEREIEELKRAISEYGGQKETSTASSPNNRQIVSGRQVDEFNSEESGYIRPSTTETRVITHRKNNRFIDPEEEIVSFKDSPQERSRRERDKEGSYDEPISTYPSVDEEDVIQVTNQADKFTDPNITKKTPKRSVRRIKERQRNQ